MRNQNIKNTKNQNMMPTILPKQYRWAILIIITLILLITPMLLRDVSFSNMTYEREKVQNYGKMNIYVDDVLVKGGRTLMVTPYDLLIMLFAGIPYLTQLLPLIFGLLSVILFKLILKEFNFSENKRFFIILLFVMTPAFIFTFSLNNYYSLILLLNFLGIFLFIKGKNKLTLTVYTILIFFGVFNFLMSILVLFLINQKLKKTIVKKTIIPLIIFIFYTIIIFLKGGIFIPKLTANLSGILADIGPLGGISIFALILALMGWGQNWKKNKKILSIVILIFLISIFYIKASFFLFPFIALLSASGLTIMLNKKWSINALKTFTILIFLLGIVFSIISYETRAPIENPTDKVIQGLEFLKESSNENDLVLTHYSRGLWVEVFSKRPVLLDSNFGGIKDYEERALDTKTVFHTYDLKKVKDIFNKYDIKYVIVDKELYEGIVWEKSDQELLYLMTDKDAFNKIYSNSEITIWNFIG